MAVMILCFLPAMAIASKQRQVLMFQPGQSAWEWIVVPARHDGARRLREGRTCLYCHEGEERAIGAAIGSGQRLEPHPMPGMPHVLDLDFTATRDGDNLRLRLSWPAVRAGSRSQLTVSFGSDAIPTTAIAGCWMSCHSDLPTMPDALAGPGMTKYLPNSRARMTATGGGRESKSAAELAAELGQGRFLDYVQARLGDGAVERVVDGYILDARHEHAESVSAATARIEDGHWIVEITRPLAQSGEGRLSLHPGQRYTVGIAIHENHAEGRHHYVSFPLELTVPGG